MPWPIDPPIQPMLSRAAADIPRGDEWRYEPKWDGFRAIVFRDGDAIRIDSRNARPLDRYFPELTAPLRDALPDPCVADGEIILPGDHALDFGALQLRLHPAASRVTMLSKQIPASFVAFDLLHDGTADIRTLPLDERRTRLCAQVKPNDSVLLTPHTTDADQAADWFERFEGAGLDGLIAKRFDLPYVEGERVMIKIKHQRTADVVVGGYRIGKDGTTLGSLLLGLYDERGTLHHVGFTSSMNAKQKREALAMLQPLRGEGGFGDGRTPGTPSRWSGGKDMEWVSLRPELVCEVAFDKLEGDRFRHGASLLRWRPDKDPKDCGYDQLQPPHPFSLDQIREIT